MLTSLSWITFIMEPSALSDRCNISLTLLLALNVFQLILSVWARVWQVAHSRVPVHALLLR
jgi:hypothetical protein